MLFDLDFSAVAPRLVRVHHAHDADEHAHNLSQWNQTYDQLSSGHFDGSVTELWLPKSQIFVETANQSLRQSCAAWDRSVWFGIPAPRAGLMSMGGRPIDANAVCVRRGGEEFELLTAPDFNLFGVVVDQAAFEQYLQATEARSLDTLLARRSTIALPLALKTRLCAALTDILADADRMSPNQDALQERIFASLARLLTAEESLHRNGGDHRGHRPQLLREIRDYILSQPETPPTVQDLCERFHISRRALQNCFADQTGLSPLSWIRALRLNAVRRELRDPGSSASVSTTALAWGFNHLSQFAQDYRKLFGELPSETRRGH